MPDVSSFVENLLKQAKASRAAGEAMKAVALAREAVKLAPASYPALSNLGLLLFETGNIEESIQCCREAIASEPGRAEAHVLLGMALRSKGDSDGAALSFTRALELRADLFEAAAGLGAVRHAAGRLAEAKELYCAALRLRPDNAATHFRLGNILREWKALGEAETCFRNTLKFEPGHANALLNLGEVLQVSGMIEASEEVLRRAVALDPGNDLARSNLFISMNYSPARSPQEIFDAHRAWGAEIFGRTRQAGGGSFANDRNPARQIRIGYLSSDFCAHPAAAFLEPVLENHDSTRFAVYCYSQGNHADETTLRLRKHASGWRETRELDDDKAERLIRGDAIDILVDCTGHMADNRLPLFGRQCAPVQVSWIGYPCTTGLPTIGYRFTDDITGPPEEQGFFVEKLVRLKSSFCVYKPPAAAPAVSRLPALAGGVITFGSLHNLARLNEKVIALWAGAMSRIAGSRLLIARDTLNESIISRLRSACTSRGIEAGRLEFVRTIPEAGHLCLYDRIDIALDTVPWSGHTTACEALWMGVPVVTLRGDRYAGRMVASILTGLGLEKCVAASEGRFAAVAASLAGDLRSLAALRSSLRERMRLSPLCDGPGFTRLVEQEYRTMWETWCGQNR